jgi:hypothetical protein
MSLHKNFGGTATQNPDVPPGVKSLSEVPSLAPVEKAIAPFDRVLPAAPMLTEEQLGRNHIIDEKERNGVHFHLHAAHRNKMKEAQK